MNAPFQPKRADIGTAAQTRFLADLMLRGILEEGTADHMSEDDRRRVIGILRPAASPEFQTPIMRG